MAIDLVRFVLVAPSRDKIPFTQFTKLEFSPIVPVPEYLHKYDTYSK